VVLGLSDYVKHRQRVFENRPLKYSDVIGMSLALTLPTSGGRTVGIVRLRTTATEFSFNTDEVTGG
jgi:hypothetical protein